MQSEIVLDSGLSIMIEGRPAQGTKHEVLFGVLRDTGEAVVVKLGAISGALAREGAALEYLAARGGPVPQLKASGLIDVSGERVACLVVKRQDGNAPATRDGWRRMGRALGCLAEPVSDVAQLTVLDRERFGVEHARRVHELGECLTAIVATVPDWPALASAEVPRPGPLVLTHGDPGPGNFLDDGRGGWLIDWEEAHVAPRGLDLERLAFIAWLGSGPAGFVGGRGCTAARPHRHRRLGVTREPAWFAMTDPDEGVSAVHQSDWVHKAPAARSGVSDQSGVAASRYGVRSCGRVRKVGLWSRPRSRWPHGCVDDGV